MSKDLRGGQRKRLSNRRYHKDLRGISPETNEYWEELLRRDGLTMDAGRHKAISYVGDTNNLQNIQEKIVAGTESPKESLHT